MKISTRILAAASIAIGCLSINAAVADDLDQLTVGYMKIPTLSPIIHAQNSGIFERHGLEVEITVVNLGSDLMTGLASGSMDFISSPAAAGIQARLAGLPVTAIGTSSIETTDHVEFVIVGNADRGISRASDLNGRVVGILEKGSPAELHIRDHMVRDGGDPDTVEFVALPFPQLPSALEVGNVDAIGVAPPFSGQILRSDKITPILLGEGMVASLEEDGQAALGAWLAMEPWVNQEENQDKFSRFLAAVMESHHELMGERTLIDAILVSEFGMPEDVAPHIPMSLNLDTLVAIPSDYSPLIDAYNRTGMAEVDFSAEDYVTTIEY